MTIPVFVALAASVLLRERLNWVRIASFLLALSGVLLTSVSDLLNAHLFGGKYLAGNLIFLAACAGCGFYNALERTGLPFMPIVHSMIFWLVGSKS